MDNFPDIGLPDWGLSDSTNDDVTNIRLGDGYEFRAANGINFRRETWSPRWSHLDDEAGEMAYAWLLERKNITAFLWYHPTRKAVFKVVCREVQLVADEFGNRRLNATFERDFNP